VQDQKELIKQANDDYVSASKEASDWKERCKKIEAQLFEQRKDFQELEKQVKLLQELEREFPLQLKKITDKYNEAVGCINALQDKLANFEILKKEIKRLLEKNTKPKE
jgi:predicted  nucleic acid-binding Zn-ribbon protein